MFSFRLEGEAGIFVLPVPPFLLFWGNKLLGSDQHLRVPLFSGSRIDVHTDASTNVSVSAADFSLILRTCVG